MEHYIRNPKALFDETILEETDNERLFMGSGSNGIVFDATHEGIEVNGYYEGHNKGTKYANLRKPLIISWEELDKIKQRTKSIGEIVPDFVEDPLDEKYLATLPIVHINDKEYYIDGARRERRGVSKPQDVYKF